MMWIGGIYGRREQMRLWIYPLEAFARFCTGKQMMTSMGMLDMLEAFGLFVNGA
jgi:hypothetical protein